MICDVKLKECNCQWESIFNNFLSFEVRQRESEARVLKTQTCFSEN